MSQAQGEPTPPAKVNGRDQGVMGIPSLEIFAGLGIGRQAGHVDFSPAYPMTGEHVRKVKEGLRRGSAEAGISWPGRQGGFYGFPKILLPIIGLPATTGHLDHLPVPWVGLGYAPLNGSPSSPPRQPWEILARTRRKQGAAARISPA